MRRLRPAEGPHTGALVTAQPRSVPAAAFTAAAYMCVKILLEDSGPCCGAPESECSP